VDEMMNSPEIKPIRPVIKRIPIKRSLYKSLMGKSPSTVERLLNYASTIMKVAIVDNITRNIFIVSFLVDYNGFIIDS
jgi:hypothetical protein